MRCTTRVCVGTIPFNIYLSYFFLFSNETDVCNFGDDTTFCVSKKLAELLEKLERNSELTIWSEDNYMKSNTDKCVKIRFGKKLS